MLEVEDIVHVGVASSLDLFAMLANAFLIFVVLRKTPKDLASYAPLILNISIVDLLSAFCNCMSVIRMQSRAGHMFMEYLGPCTLLHAHACHFFLSMHSALVIQSVHLLVLAFAYRLWMLSTTIEQKKRQKLLWPVAQLIIALCAILNTWVYCNMASFDVPNVPNGIVYSALDLTGGLAKNPYSWVILGIQMATHGVSVSSILPIRRRLFAQVGKLKSADRHNHHAIYRSLTIQMLLPLSYGVGLSLWMLDFMGIINSRLAQRSVLVMPILFAIGSPLINMYYIRPYKRYIKSIFSGCNQIAPLDKTISMHRSETKF